MKTFKIAAAVLLGSSVPLMAAVSTPLEIRQNDIPFNYQSQRGVPLSSTVNSPVGSDGRTPTQAQQIAEDLTINPPTAGQFAGLTAFGGTPGLTQADWQAVKNSAVLTAGATPMSATVATEMRLPVARANNAIVMIVQRVQIGAPFMGRQVSFLFGSEIAMPDTDENGSLLTNIVKEAFWLAEPHSANGHTNAPYYWSPNARKVFAIQSGPLTITWVKAYPYTAANLPTYTNPNGSPSFLTNGGSIYLLYTARYVASGSSVKTPRKMYWTEREFRSLGKPVAVPTARIGGVKVVYNENFPKTVATEYAGPGRTSPTDGTTNQVMAELRTLWYDQAQGQIYSYNLEGRVFLELLGDARTDGSRVHLGFEIVDVLRQPSPADVMIELGERLTPPGGASDQGLFPDPVVQASGGMSPIYRHNVAGSERLEIYAIRETQNLNDCLVHWLEAGIQGLRWPALLGRYKLAWPANETKYSHYVRPPATTEDEAKETAVVLATENAPMIEYQDPFDSPRAKLTEEFKFFTWLDATVPAHRTLLRFTPASTSPSNACSPGSTPISRRRTSPAALARTSQPSPTTSTIPPPTQPTPTTFPPRRLMTQLTPLTLITSPAAAAA